MFGRWEYSLYLKVWFYDVFNLLDTVMNSYSLLLLSDAVFSPRT